MRLTEALKPSDEEGCTTYIPALPGCISEGETVDNTLHTIRGAIELYLEPVEDDQVLDERALVQVVDL